MKKGVLLCFVWFSFFGSFGVVLSQIVRNDVLEVKKTVVQTESSIFLVEVSWRALGEVSKIQVIDDVPEGVTVQKGSLVFEASRNPTSEWDKHNYSVSVDVEEELYFLNTTHVKITLPAARISYIRKGEKERESLMSSPVDVETKFQVLPQGGWLLDHETSTLVVAFFTLVFPMVAAINLINLQHQKSLAKKSS